MRGLVPSLLCIAKHHHETTVHVILLMTMEESVAGIVGDKFNFRRGPGGNKDHILHETAHLWAVVNLANFESVPVQMHWMVIHAEVLHDEPIASTCFQDRLIGLRIGFAVDSPQLFIAVTLKL